MAEPLAVSEQWVRRQMTRLGPLIDAQEEDVQALSPLLSSADIAREHILTAQYELREACGMPFFSTRFVTGEVATAEALVLDTDYDELIDPVPYEIEAWRFNTGELDFRYTPVSTLTRVRFALHDNKIADLPDEWLNVVARQGQVHTIAYGGNPVYFNLITLFPFYQPGMMAGILPAVLHLQYTAGLVSRTAYDPDAAAKSTSWGQMEVVAYQSAIARLAAAKWMWQLGNALDAGGVSAAIDGMSESINPGVMDQRAQKMSDAAMAWANRVRDQQRGPVMVVI